MIKASDLRREYCEGRVALEEAKILDKKGDHSQALENTVQQPRHLRK